MLLTRRKPDVLFQLTKKVFGAFSPQQCSAFLQISCVSSVWLLMQKLLCEAPVRLTVFELKRREAQSASRLFNIKPYLQVPSAISNVSRFIASIVQLPNNFILLVKSFGNPMVLNLPFDVILNILYLLPRLLNLI